MESIMGCKAKDKITGFTGIITGKASYITGCDQYLVQPICTGNSYKDGRWFDDGRLIVVKRKKFTKNDLKSKTGVGPDLPAPKK